MYAISSQFSQVTNKPNSLSRFSGHGRPSVLAGDVQPGTKMIRSSDGKELLMKVKRDGEIQEIKVAPQSSKVKNLFGEEVNIFMIGITPTEEVLVEKVNPAVALGMGFAQTWNGIKLTLVT